MLGSVLQPADSSVIRQVRDFCSCLKKRGFRFPVAIVKNKEIVRSAKCSLYSAVLKVCYDYRVWRLRPDLSEGTN